MTVLVIAFFAIEHIIEQDSPQVFADVIKVLYPKPWRDHDAGMFEVREATRIKYDPDAKPFADIRAWIEEGHTKEDSTWGNVTPKTKGGPNERND